MYEHFIPADALNKIRSVNIHYNVWITGFCFFDKDGALLREIGNFYRGYGKDTVELAENEVIVGVVAKLWGDYQSAYSDF